MPNLLVVDDEPSILHAFRRAFRDQDVNLLTAGSGRQALQVLAQHQADAVVLDINLPDISGLELFSRLHQMDPKLPVILITGHGTAETAIEAIKAGAYDYLFKPLELDELRALVQQAFRISRLMRVPALLEGEEPADARSDLLLGRCPAMVEVYKAIGRVAPQDVTVLIQGESGTGKELVARAIYHHSRRANGPFLAINCAAIPETLLESELFGHEKGAFTGADYRRIGKFEQCHDGTLFLDEIGDMSPLTQSKILRVLQDGQFERVGGSQPIRSNVRIIAATNRDLQQLTDAGRFRHDLFYRLSVFTIRLPPLRDRQDDLPLLVEHFLKRFAAELGKEPCRVDPDTLELLRRYPWPGNVRELQSVLKQALLQAAGPVLVPEFLPDQLRNLAARAGSPASAQPASQYLEHFLTQRLEAGTGNLYAETIRMVERLLLTRVLEHVGGNQAQAARILGITRGTLRNKLATLGLRTPGTDRSSTDQAAE